MVIVRNITVKWVRRYKFFFLFGVAVLTLQLYLAIRFITLSRSNAEEKWQPQNYVNIKIKGDSESSVNSARQVKDGPLDDEDTQISSISKGGKIRSKSNISQLRLEELDFIPACEIKGKEAISAIHRAKTQKCKKIIANVSCLATSKKLYPMRLSNYCPNNGYEAGKAIGCFKDEKDYRILNGYYGVYKKDNSPENCINLCLQSGFTYAGVEYSNECFCGSDEPSSAYKLPDSSCNMKCPGDSQGTCGGYFTINIYQTGIIKFIPQIAYNEKTTKKPVRIVFLLTLNGRALRQVKRLIKIIYHKHHYFYIHVDVRQDYLFRELLFLERKFPNIKLTRKRYATIWGGASLLEMLLSCMKEILKLEWKWDFLLNLSESDYPVKSISRLTTFLTANRDRNFVKSHGREVQRFIQKQGLDKTFVECDTHMWRVADRKLPWGIQVDGGSDWIALNVEFVTYVAGDYPDDLIEGLLSIFHHTLLPAESFFHTVLRNSMFCNSYVDNNLHVTNWKRKLGCKCQYKHVVDWCGCSPNDFKPEDWPRILGTETRQLYFARKFEPIISQSIIFQLELWLLGLEKPFSPIVSINSYWQNIYHHHDLGVAPDDALLTISHSAIRSWFKSFNNSSCIPTVEKLQEVTSYHFKDNYKYTLLKFKTEEVIFEMAIRPLHVVSVLKHSSFIDKLELLIVSSDYDQKEQIFRNFARILSPYSEPALVFQFANRESSTKQINISCLWINPSGRLSEVTEISIDENNFVGHSKPNIKQPLLPGRWNVALVYKNTLLAEVKFLVTPLEFYSGKEISRGQVTFVHGGSFSRNFSNTFNQFLPNDFDTNILERLTISNSKRYGEDLREWIDTLFNRFYTVEKVCAIDSNTIVCNQSIPICSKSRWSSFYPDPKSAIDKINSTSGSFDSLITVV